MRNSWHKLDQVIYRQLGPFSNPHREYQPMTASQNAQDTRATIKRGAAARMKLIQLES